MKKQKIDVRRRITENLSKDTAAVERAMVALDDRDLWKWKGDGLNILSYRRAKYLASWARNGKHYTGRFVEEARQIALQHVPQLVQCSLEKTRQIVKGLEKRIQTLKEWEKACEEELAQLPFDAPQQQSPLKEEIDGKSIREVCLEEGLY